MQFRIPLFIYQHKSGYTARPLFFAAPCRTDDNLNRLLTKLTRDIVQTLESLGRASRHDAASAWAFCPHVTTHRVPLTIELRRRIIRVKHVIIAFNHFEKRIAFAPTVAELWFEIARNETIEDRAQAVLSDHWRKLEREADDEDEIRPEAGQLAGKAWVQVLEVSVAIPTLVPKPPVIDFLLLGGSGTADGASELRRVGRCLDWFFRMNSTVLCSVNVKPANSNACSARRTVDPYCCADLDWPARPTSCTNVFIGASPPASTSTSSVRTSGSYRRNG